MTRYIRLRALFLCMIDVDLFIYKVLFKYIRYALLYCCDLSDGSIELLVSVICIVAEWS